MPRPDPTKNKALQLSFILKEATSAMSRERTSTPSWVAAYLLRLRRVKHDARFLVLVAAYTRSHHTTQNRRISLYRNRHTTKLRTQCTRAISPVRTPRQILDMLSLITCFRRSGLALLVKKRERKKCTIFAFSSFDRKNRLVRWKGNAKP